MGIPISGRNLTVFRIVGQSRLFFDGITVLLSLIHFHLHYLPFYLIDLSSKPFPAFGQQKNENN